MEGSRTLGGRDLGGPQARLLLVRLGFRDREPVATGELLDLLWPAGPPPAWEVALRALASNLRAALEAAGLGREALVSRPGHLSLELPAKTWVDVRAAADCVDRAEGLIRRGRHEEAFGWAGGANAIALRPLLLGYDSAWISARREELRSIRMRALECCAAVFLEAEQHAVAAKVAQDMIDLSPYHERGWQHLMTAQAASGNRAEAVATYHRLRALLEEELGVDPSPQSQQLFRELLRT